MAERRLRFRRNEPPATEKESEVVVPPLTNEESTVEWSTGPLSFTGLPALPNPDDLEAGLTQLLGDPEEARRIVERANTPPPPSPPPARTGVGLDVDRMDRMRDRIRRIMETGRYQRVLSTPNSLPARHPQEWYIPTSSSEEDFVDIFMAGQSVISGLTRREATNLVNAHNRAISVILANQPPPRDTTRGRIISANIEIERHMEEVGLTHRYSQMVTTERPTIDITIRGEGDPATILRNTADSLTDPSAPITFGVRNNVRR